MGKMTVETIGTIQIKIDTKDDIYYDAKDPHVSFIRKGTVIHNHILLDEVDDIVGTGDSDLQDAIRYVRKNKEYIKKLYYENNRK